MNENKQFDDASKDRSEHIKLARWLHDLLARSSRDTTNLSATNGGDESEFELLLSGDYHPRFYQQLPDFIMALLRNDPRATIRYAPLLYHWPGGMWSPSRTWNCMMRCDMLSRLVQKYQT